MIKETRQELPSIQQNSNDIHLMVVHESGGKFKTMMFKEDKESNDAEMGAKDEDKKIANFFAIRAMSSGNGKCQDLGN